jgi:hypothetical protein
MSFKCSRRVSGGRISALRPRIRKPGREVVYHPHGRRRYRSLRDWESSFLPTNFCRRLSTIQSSRVLGTCHRSKPKSGCLRLCLTIRMRTVRPSAISRGSGAGTFADLRVEICQIRGMSKAVELRLSPGSETPNRIQQRHRVPLPSRNTP